MSRTYNILTVALLSLTVLLTAWAAIVFVNPASPLNPLPPPTQPDTPTRAGTAAPVTRVALETLRFPTPLPTYSETPTPTVTDTSTSTPIPSETPTRTAFPTATRRALTSPPPALPALITPGATSPAQAPAPTRTPPPPPPAAGASGGSFELGGQVAGFDDPEKMKYAGMTWVKRQLRWSPGANPNDAGGLIDDAHAKGFKILLSVLGDPESIRGGTNNASFASYAGAVAALGADGIEVWNEMNIDREWPIGEIGPAAYTEMLRQAYTAIKASHPDTLVISGAPAPTGFFGGCSGAGCDDKPYIEGMVNAGALNYLDCIGIHYNEGVVSPFQTAGDPRGNPTHYTRYYQTMVDTYYNAARGRRKLCFTELGYLSGEEWGMLPPGFLWKPPFNLTVAEHAQYLAEAARLSRDQGKVRLMIVFNVDLKTFDSDPQAGYAILRPNGLCPACETLRAVVGGR